MTNDQLDGLSNQGADLIDLIEEVATLAKRGKITPQAANAILGDAVEAIEAALLTHRI